MNGNIVWNKTNTAASSLSSSKIDVSKMPAGIYVLQITGISNNTIVTKKIFVSR